MTGDVEVPALAQQLAIGTDQHRPDRDLVELTLGAVGECQGVMHPVEVVVCGCCCHRLIGHG
ncbi:hypothetical protein D3C81_1805710 [compost metagenome]